MKFPQRIVAFLVSGNRHAYSTCRHSRTEADILLTIVIGMSLSLFFVSNAAAAAMYWTVDDGPAGGDGRIVRANLDGSGATNIIAALGNPKGIVTTHNYIYWADSWTDRIQRANLDGSNITTIVSGGLLAPWGITVTDSHIYFSEATGTGSIIRVNLNGTNRVTLVPGLGAPRQLDIYNNQLYWIDSSTNLIQRCDLDGSNLATVITLPRPFGTFLGLAVTSESIFWTHYSVGIFKSNLDGSYPSMLDGEPVNLSIGLDFIDESLYWTSADGGKIGRSDADGSNRVELVTGISRVQYVAVYVPEPSTCLFFVLGLRVLARRAVQHSTQPNQ